MTEAKTPGDDAVDDAPGPRRSTYSPPPADAEIPLTLGEEPVGTPQAPQATPQPPSPPATPAAPPVAPPVTPPVAPAPAAISLPGNMPPPPVRASLSDQQIMEQMGHGGNTDQLIGALQDQMVLRQQEDEEFDSWATLIRQNFDEETAEEAIAAARHEFDGDTPPQAGGVVDTEPVAAPVAQEPEPPVDQAVVEQEASEDIILPRFGAGEAPAVVDDTPASQPAESDFEKLISDSEAVSPPTDAWPLVSETAEATEPVAETEPEPETPVVTIEALMETQVVVAEDSGGQVVAQSVSVQEFLSTKETRQVAFDDVELEIAPASRFGFDHVGEEPTPGNVRVDRALQLFWAWWAVGSPIVGILVGAWLVGQGLNLSQAITVSVIGVVLASLPVLVGTVKGIRYGLPTLVSARAAYGLVGNVVPSIVMTLVRIAVAAAALWAGSWMVSGILVESNYWNGQEAIIAVVTSAIVVLIAVALAVAGRGFIHLTLWVSATLATLGLIGVVLVTLGQVSGAAFDQPAGSLSAVVAGMATVMSVFLVVWAHFGADLSRFQDPWSPKTSTSLAAVGAVIPPLLLLAWGALLGASNAEFREGLLTNFFDTVLELAPGWYPIPAVLFLALPLVALGALALHSSGYAVMSLGAKMPRYVAVSIASAIAAIASIGAIVFVPSITDYLLELTLVAGVVVAAWVGGYTGELVTRRVYLDPRLLTGQSGDFPRWRVAPVLGFVAASAIGWGLIESSVSWLAWTGYVSDLLGQVAIVDFAGWQLGPLAALLIGYMVSSLAGIRGGITISRQQVSGS